MMLRSATAALVAVAAITGFAQGTSPGTSPAAAAEMSKRQSQSGKTAMSSPAANKAASPQAPATLRERVQDMEGTLARMHAVLKQMHTRAASNSRDPLAKSNLEMWELMVGHLDEQLRELRIAMMVREDYDARRAAMYKEAEAKADAVAREARRRAASQPSPNTVEGTGQPPANSGASPTPEANSSPSPN